MAMKYFGKTDVVGRMLDTRDGDKIRSYKITAVVKAHSGKQPLSFRLPSSL